MVQPNLRLGLVASSSWVKTCRLYERMGVVILAVDLGKTSCRAAAGGRRAEGVRAPALSTSGMIALGKAYLPRMVDVRATDAKLRRRAVRGRVRDALGTT